MRKLLISISAFYCMLISVYYSSRGPVEMIKQSSVHDELYAEEKQEDDELEVEEEGKTDEPSKFTNFHSGIRTREGENGPAYPHGYKWTELRKAQQVAQMRRSTRKKSNGVIAWTERGPANVPGRTRAVFNIPGDPSNNTWLAGAATGGIWRTVNGGQSWSEESGDFTSLPISSFGADRDATVIYAGTGEFLSSFYSALGNGIYKSSDKGNTWEQIPATRNHPDFSIVTRLIVHPDNPQIVLATTAPHDQSGNKFSAIMRTINGGATWEKVKEIEGVFEQITFTPGHFDVQFASQKGVGVWKSTDAGATWQLSNHGMIVSGRVEISVSPVFRNIVFASAEGNLSGKAADLYYSSDAGASWSLVDVKFNGTAIDFLEGQGFYDNTILCDPFSSSRVYVGGVSLFKVSLSSGSSNLDTYNLEASGTESFLAFQSFSGVLYENGKLDVGANAGKIKVEVRFGPGKGQKAHRFMVPVNRTNGTGPNDYNYHDYVDVPFEVWDITNQRQLMVSFRDQNRNGNFDLMPEYLTNNGVDYLLNSREYIFIHDLNYTLLPSSEVSKTGGQITKIMYNFFPALAEGADWQPSQLPASKIVIEPIRISRLNANTEVIADGRGFFDQKNQANQVELTKGVHADHHCLIAIPHPTQPNTYKLLLGNDGGVFVSNNSVIPGTKEGDWKFCGYGLNTTQFYGADKEPGGQRYIGGAQDNGTRVSAKRHTATALSEYEFAVDGDGFESLWNNKDASLLLATKYYGQVSRSTDGGGSWNTVRKSDHLEFPFVTKLANSKDLPDRVFTVGKKGVYISEDFGSTWRLSPIDSKFVINSSLFLDVEVSRANANVVWAGSGMNNTTAQRNLFVSTDGGNTFLETSNYNTVALGNITRLASHPTQEKTAYALFSFAKAPKILRTTDLGETWQDISGFGTGTTSANGFPDVAVYCLYVRPDNPNVIWAGTEIGIVESIDNGASWQLLEEFPHVAVWDLKGQDDEVVIATHGRGIWTATIDQPQHVVAPAEIEVAGTTPQGHFAVRIKSANAFDSVQVFVNDSFSRNIQTTTPVLDLEFTGLSTGQKKIKLLCWKNEVPYQSMVYSSEHYELAPPRDFYSTYFRSNENLSVKGMSVRILTGPNHPFLESLQTDHPYSSRELYEVLFRVPIVVSSSLSTVFFSDIAIIEPVHDGVLLEATKNGLDWTTMTRYDARTLPQWQKAFDDNISGTNDMYTEQSVELSSFFNPGDLILIRIRLVTNSSVNSWGWALKYMSIQEFPTATEKPFVSSASTYPNPTNGMVEIEYALAKASNVRLQVLNIFGGKVYESDLGYVTAGSHSSRIDLQGKPAGTYMILIKSQNENSVAKVILRH